MDEININIEGYNVNGICVACLNYNRRMYYSDDMTNYYKILGNIEVPVGLSVKVCTECLASVNSIKRFQRQIIQSYKILKSYSKKHKFLQSPSDLSKHAVERFAVSKLVISQFNGSDDETDKDVKFEVKSELKDEECQVFNTISEQLPVVAVDDFPIADLNRNTSDDEEWSAHQLCPETTVEDFATQEVDDTSEDEDLQLSKLKEKKSVDKEKKFKDRSKKRKKRKKDKSNSQKIDVEDKINRKLRHFPKDSVEIYTMSEEEMWKVRSDDINHEEFVKIKYKCNNCLISFNVQKAMNYHMSSKHEKKNEDSQQCDVCKAYFIAKDLLHAHRALHQNAFRCVECGFLTTLKTVMLHHSFSHVSGEKYKCNICDTGFDTKSKLNYHKTVVHQEKPQCDCCGKIFANKMTLKYHLKAQKQENQTKTKEKLYLPCKGCDKVFSSRKSYRAHAVIHNGLTYPCQICGKQFQWKRNLARHTRNHREKDAGSQYQCRECGKSFASRDCYNNHMRLSKRHVGEEAYVHTCNYCGKKFATKWCMVDHIDWDHLKKIKYQCSVCFKAFKTAKIMVAHTNNIHGDKKNVPEIPHLCDICGKSYKTEKRLKGHVWAMHTKRSTTKSFRCKHCPATFTWQTSIYKHMKMMHDTKRNKQPRGVATKKPEHYPALELTPRVNYFEQNQPRGVSKKPEPFPGLELAPRVHYFDQTATLAPTVLHDVTDNKVDLVHNI